MVSMSLFFSSAHWMDIKHLIASLPELCRSSSAFPVLWVASGHPNRSGHAAILHDGFSTASLEKRIHSAMLKIATHVQD